MAHNQSPLFAYLHIYSRYSPFGGVSEVASLARQLVSQTSPAGSPVVAALTDVFSVAGAPLWQAFLKEQGCLPLAGAEIGVQMAATGKDRSLPYGLLLLAAEPAGYANLCRLISAGRQAVGANPLTAAVDLDTLNKYRQGLIAISVYNGGPVTAALLAHKTAEARQRAQRLADIFGADFLLGAPPPAAQPQPHTIDEKPDASEVVRLNAALVKLSRELRIGLVGTGETRYARPEEAHEYFTLLNRLEKTIAAQYSKALLKQPVAAQDWLYSPRDERPVSDLHLRTADELIAHYNEADWPGALANNRRVAERCSGWLQSETTDLDSLRNLCQTALAGLPPEEQPEARTRLEAELNRLADLKLAAGLLAAVFLLEKAGQDLYLLPRGLAGSQVAYLLGLTAYPPQPDFSFQAYQQGEPLKLEAGFDVEDSLLEILPDYISPVARPGEMGEPAWREPQRLLVSFAGPLEERVAIVPAKYGGKLLSGAECGPLAPAGTAIIEVEPAEDAQLVNLILRIANRHRTSLNQPLLGGRDLPPVLEAGRSPDDYDAGVAGRQAEWFKLHQTAAFYAAHLTLAAANQTRLAAIAEQVRQQPLALLPPDINASQVEFSLENPEPAAIRSGLLAVLDPETARLVIRSRPDAGFAGLDELVKNVPLTEAQVDRLAWSGALDRWGERESLAGAAVTIANSARQWQEWRQAQLQPADAEAGPDEAADGHNPDGQLSLFDLFTPTLKEPASLSPEEPAPISLPVEPKISKLERLRFAYRALGYFTSEHPLWPQAPRLSTDISRADPVGLANAALADSRNAALLVAGLITGVRRLPIAAGGVDSPGQELTVLQIEDFSGRAELLIPATTPLSDAVIAQGEAVTARARRLAGSERPVLVALAVAAYPAVPGEVQPVTGDDSGPLPASEPPDIAGEQTPAELAPPSAEEGWSNSLFSGLAAGEVARPQTAAPPSETAGKSGKKTPPPRVVPRQRKVHIHLPSSPDYEAEFEILDSLKQILRRYEGEDALVLYLPQPDGSTSRLEPQSLRVKYSDDFAAEVMNLLGPQSVRLEER